MLNTKWTVIYLQNTLIHFNIFWFNNLFQYYAITLKKKISNFKTKQCIDETHILQYVQYFSAVSL